MSVGIEPTFATEFLNILWEEEKKVSPVPLKRKSPSIFLKNR